MTREPGLKFAKHFENKRHQQAVNWALPDLFRGELERWNYQPYQYFQITAFSYNTPL